MNCQRCNGVVESDFISKYENHCRRCANAASKIKYKKINKEKIYSSKLHIIGSRRRNERYRLKNREKIKQGKKNYYRRKMKNSPSFRIENSIRNHIYSRLKLRNLCKNSETIKYLGCNIDQLMAHLQSLFKPGMTWENYGYCGWHIDHKIPISKFDLTKEEERFKCFHFSNLQPLWAQENLSKGNRETFKNYL